MRRFLWVQLAIAALALLVGVGALVTTVPKAQAFLGVCTYYQTAAKKKVVGQRGTGCCGEPVYCLDVWCPPPTE